MDRSRVAAMFAADASFGGPGSAAAPVAMRTVADPVVSTSQTGRARNAELLVTLLNNRVSRECRRLSASNRWCKAEELGALRNLAGHQRRSR
jgi:hypothetical protein